MVHNRGRLVLARPSAGLRSAFARFARKSPLILCHEIIFRLRSGRLVLAAALPPANLTDELGFADEY